MAKLNYQIEYHPEAVREIHETIQWYRDRNEAASGEFRSLLKSAESLVQIYPEAWAFYLQNTRGFLLRKFPYVLVYIIQGKNIIIVALAHNKRRPGYWRDRLK